MNNDVLRRLRFIFSFNDEKMIEIFGLSEVEVTRAQVSDWLKKDDDPAFKRCNDIDLSAFLNGLIIAKRGKKDDVTPKPEKKLNNNQILRKLMIALTLKSEDVLDILKLADFRFGKAELSSFFRKKDHKHYRACKDQVLRNFLMGLQLKHLKN